MGMELVDVTSQEENDVLQSAFENLGNSEYYLWTLRNFTISIHASPLFWIETKTSCDEKEGVNNYLMIIFSLSVRLS